MKKTVKAWAVLNKKGGITSGSSLDIHRTKGRADAMVVMRDNGYSRVPCTITYEVPAKKEV